ncbi:MAG: integrase [Psychrobacillus sp.]
MSAYMQQSTNEFLYELIYSTIKATGLNTMLEEDHTGVNMSYNFITNVVSFDANRLVEAAGELPSIPFDHYVKTITLHELGHAIDRPALDASLTRTLDYFDMRDQYSTKEIFKNPDLLGMLIEEHQMNIAFEETAWANAENLNEKLLLIDQNTFEMIKNHSLSTYINNYEEDLAVYKQLLEQTELQPA